MKRTVQCILILLSLVSMSFGKIVMIDLDNQEDLRQLRIHYKRILETPSDRELRTHVKRILETPSDRELRIHYKRSKQFFVFIYFLT